MIGADGGGQAGEAISPEQLRQTKGDPADQRRAAIDQSALELQQRGSGTDLGIGLFRRADPADADQGQAALGQAIHIRQQSGRGREQRLTGQTTGFLGTG
jgi:hypothetical protein